MAFRREIRVFDRSGRPIGVIGKWAATGPRSYRLNEIEDFAFTVPRNDGTEAIITEQAAATIVGSAQVRTGDAAVAVIGAIPTGVVAGDLLVAGVSFDRGGGSPAVVAPSGWQQVGVTYDGTNHGLAVFQRIASAAEPANPVFTSTTGASLSWAVAVVAVRGGIQVVNHAGAVSATSTAAYTGTPRTRRKGQTLLSFFGADRSCTFSGHLGELAEGAVANASIMVATTATTVVGAQSVQIASASTSGKNVSAVVAIDSPSMDQLLDRDNLVYVENDVPGMPGWAGAILEATPGDDGVSVRCGGTLGLLGALETTLIEQEEGDASSAARRLVEAAQAKQGAHGDLVVGFVADATQPQWGMFQYEGDILQGIQRLARDTLSEFYMRSWIDSTGWLRTELHWGAQYEYDLSATIIKDGPGGAIQPGAEVRFNGEARANYGRLVGAQTNLIDYLDYPIVADYLRELTPEATVALSESDVPSARRREAVDFSVNWGYSVAAQKALAKVVQGRYLKLYRQFLYAFHQRYGQPFLEGYDWSFPGGHTGKKLTSRLMRTKLALGYIGKKDVIVDLDPEGDVDARIEDWRWKYEIALAGAVGAATAHDAVFDVLVFMNTGDLLRLDSRTLRQDWDGAIGLSTVLTAPGTGAGIATDATDTSSVWLLSTTATAATLRKYDMQSRQALSEWTVAQPTMQAVAVNAPDGKVYTVATGDANVTVRDLASGASLRTFAHGVTTARGIAYSGGLVYVAGAGGKVRMLWEEDGKYAGELDTGQEGVRGIYLSPERGEAWVMLDGQVVQVYNAAIAVATVDAPGPVDGAPGFDRIFGGQFVRIVMADNRKLGGYDDDPNSPTDHGIYKPRFRSQHGWGTTFDSVNCMFASAAMAFDRHTRGAQHPTPPQLRTASGSRLRTGKFSDVETAWRVYSNNVGMARQNPDVSFFTPFREIIRKVRKERRGAILAGDNDQLPNPSGGFMGDHALYLHMIHDDGRWECWDPNLRHLERDTPAARNTDPGYFYPPFKAGVAYRTATYGGHTDYAVDFNRIDGNDLGDPVLAAAAGTVVDRDVSEGYVLVEHAGDYRTEYRHMIRVEVKIGDEVALGERIGRIGSVGNSSGPHLHHLHWQKITGVWTRIKMRIEGKPMEASVGNSNSRPTGWGIRGQNVTGWGSTGRSARLMLEPEDVLAYLKKFAYGKPRSQGGYGDRWRQAPDRGHIAFTRPTPPRQDVEESLGRAKKVYVVYSPGRWVDRTVPASQVGDPATIQKEWQVGFQKQGFKPADDVKVADPEQIVQGEEGRVADWDPLSMGYGVQGDSFYRTKNGTRMQSKNKWYLRPWDVAPSTFWITDTDPDLDESLRGWPQGEDHLRLLLTKHNREQGAQSFGVVNVGGLWERLRLGGVYTYQQSLQGPYPSGITGKIRVVAFAPDEASGTCQVMAEWVG